MGANLGAEGGDQRSEEGEDNPVGRRREGAERVGYNKRSQECWCTGKGRGEGRCAVLTLD